MSDWIIPEEGKSTLPKIALRKIVSQETSEKEKLGWARLLAIFDRNNIARAAVRKQVDAIVETDERYLAQAGVKTADELRRNPEFLAWYRDRATAADAGQPGSLCLKGIVAVGAASSSD